jgi:DNA polymerase-1
VAEVLADISGLLDSREEKAQKKKRKAKEGVQTKAVHKLTKKEQQIKEMANNTILPDHYKTVWTMEDLAELTQWLSKQDMVAVDTETMGVNPWIHEIVGISFYAPHQGYYIPLKHDEDIRNHEYGLVEKLPGIGDIADKVVGIDFVSCLPRDIVAEVLKPLLEDGGKKYLFHNAKFDMHVLRLWMGIMVIPYYDTMIAQALLDENQSKALKDIAPYYLKVEADKFGALFGKVTFNKVPILLNKFTNTGNLATYYATKDTELTYRMYEFQIKFLQKTQLEKINNLMFNIEMPFVKVVHNAEARGVPLDAPYLKDAVATQLKKDVEELRQKIWAYTGEININSPAQLSDALYIKLKLPRVNKDKPSSTDKKTLKKLKKEHPVAGMLLAFREKVKLKTAFADKLPEMIVNGLIHTSFNPVGTKTGRMSCNNPNLQQIPAKVGGLIRNAFVARPGRLLASCDFSQQELRVLAHVSQDETMLNIYRSGGDIHSMTATGMWNRKNPEFVVTYEQFQLGREVSDLFRDADGNLLKERFTDEYVAHLVEQGKLDAEFVSKEGICGLQRWADVGHDFEKTRKNAKVVNFGIIYGMQAPRLADTLEISLEEAELYVAGYFDSYPGVKKWMQEQREKMLKVKYTETMLGRKRRVYNEMDSGKRWMMESGWRMGINAVIQGSSADMVKLASIKLQPLLAEMDCHIVLWVHDEIIFDVPENIGIDNLRKLSNIMCTALPLDCGLKSDIEVGVKWGQKMSEDDLARLMVLGDEETDDEEEENVA